jgi:hypothetical protein
MKTTYLGISNHKFALKVNSSVGFEIVVDAPKFKLKAVKNNQKGNL